MYNLNYNVTNCRLNKPAGRPFVPFGRPDPYSSSLVLAIPGAIFRQGYVNVFNQINVFDDISGYLKGGAVFDENIGEYIPAYQSHAITPTGSVGFVGPNSLIKFPENGYDSSLIVSGNMALVTNQLSSSVGTEFNLTVTSSWCMEAWFAYDVTASINESPSGSNILYGSPNKIWMNKFTNATNPTGSAWIAYTGWSGKIGNPEASPPYPTGSGVPAFYHDDERNAGNPDNRINAQYDNPITPYVWQHTAITCYPTGSAGGPLTQGVVNMYINGVRVGGGFVGPQIKFAPATLVTLLGNPNPYTGSVVNAINNTNYTTGSGLFVQDFRFYNGASKYTGSSFTPPESMIVGAFEPYPQYNP